MSEPDLPTDAQLNAAAIAALIEESGPFSEADIAAAAALAGRLDARQRDPLAGRLQPRAG